MSASSEVAPPAGPLTPGELAAYRALYPVTRERTYLNHAAIGPIGTRVAEAIGRRLLERGRLPDGPDILEPYEQAQALAAKLIHAASEDVVLVPSTAHGLNTVARSLPLSEGDNVILCELEYPTNAYPWMALADRGVETRRLPASGGGLSVDRVREAADARTRAVAVSTVQFSTGHVTDLPALAQFCNEKGLMLVVDAIQSLGALELDAPALGLAAVAAGGQKWLMAGIGSGMLWINPELHDRLVPGAYVGAYSVTEPGEYLPHHFSLAPGMRRFELGLGPELETVALGVALETLLEVSVPRIEARVRHLGRLVAEGAHEQGIPVAGDPSRRAAIVCLEPPDPAAAFERLTRAGVSASLRAGRVRLSPHFYNTEDEVEAALRALAP